MIRLTLSTYIILIEDYGESQGALYPRSQVNAWPSASFSAYGTTAIDGPAYTPRFIWNFTARLSLADRQKLRRMLAYWLSNRETAWTLEDYTEEFAEASPGTRAIATGESESDDGTTTLYHAKFNAFPTQYPALSELSGNEELITLQFTEGGIVAR